MNNKTKGTLTAGAAAVVAVITLIANALLPVQVITPANFPIATGSRCVEADAVPAIGEINFAAQSFTAKISGTLEQCKYYDLANVPYKFIYADCNFCILDHQIIGSDDESKKNGSRSHAIRVGARNKPVTDVTIMNFEIYNSVLEHYLQGGSGYGSCAKVELNSKNVTIKHGKIKNCWGEGVGVTGAVNVLVQDILVHNAFHGTVYGDNVDGLTIRNVTSICDDARFVDKANNKWPSSTFFASEYYPEVPTNKLGNIDSQGNVSYGCNPPSNWGGHFGSDNGMKNAIIANNLIYDSPVKMIWIASGPRNQNIIIADNQYLTSGTPSPTPPPTMTRTITSTAGTVTPTLSRTPTVPVPASSTFTPTSTRTSTALIPATFTATNSPTLTKTPIPPSRTNTPTVTVTRTATGILWSCTVIPDVLLNCKPAIP